MNTQIGQPLVAANADKSEKAEKADKEQAPKAAAK
jgi:hypothetical protein